MLESLTVGRGVRGVRGGQAEVGGLDLLDWFYIEDPPHQKPQEESWSG